jgi:hypothetical protein
MDSDIMDDSVFEIDDESDGYVPVVSSYGSYSVMLSIFRTFVLCIPRSAACCLNIVTTTLHSGHYSLHSYYSILSGLSSIIPSIFGHPTSSHPAEILYYLILPGPQHAARIFANMADSDQKPLPKAVKKAPAKSAVAATKKMAQTTLKTKPASKKRSKQESDDESINSDSGFTNAPPKAKKQKSAPVAKTSSGKPLTEIENNSMMIEDEPAGSAKKSKSKKTATEQYQKLTQLEHIIKRPDTYIGSVEKTEQQMWVFNKETKQMELRKVTFVPGLYKIFDEILVNAADNKQRDDQGHTMTYLKVGIDRTTGEITVENNGKGIPVVLHEVSCIGMLYAGWLLTIGPEREDLHSRDDLRPPSHGIQL